MKDKSSKTTIIEKFGHRVSITENPYQKNGGTYVTYRIKGKFGGRVVTKSASTFTKAEKQADALIQQMRKTGGVVKPLSLEQSVNVEAAIKICQDGGFSL